MLYGKIPLEIKPTEASAKVTYASSFDPEFFLLLRERRATLLVHMQDASLEVEYNLLAVDKCKRKSDRDTRRGKSKATASDSLVAHPEEDESTRLIKSLSAEVERLKLEAK